MPELPPYPPLTALHPDSYLSPAKLAKMSQLSTDALTQSLLPGQKECLKTRPDGTILDGHHRIPVTKGLLPEAAVQKISVAQGTSVPETAEQRHWIDHYAEVLAGTK
jgi:hypothetical protein